jgi:hypothetical protein
MSATSACTQLTIQQLPLHMYLHSLWMSGAA